MSRDSYGATERWSVLSVEPKTRDIEYSIPGVFGSPFSIYRLSVAP